MKERAPIGIYANYGKYQSINHGHSSMQGRYGGLDGGLLCRISYVEFFYLQEKEIFQGILEEQYLGSKKLNPSTVPITGLSVQMCLCKSLVHNT